jgi:hypothetical protein
MIIENSFKSKIKSNLNNILGWKTKRKIVVIESDDWGTIRTPSSEVLNKISRKHPVELSVYDQFDSLETENDLSALFDLLRTIKKLENKSPVITANCIIANPDFDKIKNNNYLEYEYEIISDTFNRNSHGKNCLSLWRSGFADNLFKPQFHGREHLNVSFWIEQLHNDELTKMMFECKFWSLIKTNELNFVKKNSMAGCNYSSQKELEFIKKSLKEGLAHFETLLGYKSKSFIANNYIWDDEIEKILNDNGVLYIQGQSFQLFPFQTRERIQKKGRRHYLGQPNKFNQLYLTRNCFFEPCTDINFNDSISSCLNEINISFSWFRPAIISSHRVNYIGSLSENNRKTGLEKLKILIESIIKRYPDVEFMTTDQLGDLIMNDNN